MPLSLYRRFPIKSWGIPIASRFFHAAAWRGVSFDFHFLLMVFRLLLLAREGAVGR